MGRSTVGDVHIAILTFDGYNELDSLLSQHHRSRRNGAVEVAPGDGEVAATVTRSPENAGGAAPQIR